MRQQKNRVFFNLLFSLMALWLLTGHAAAAMAPDSRIEVDLKALFSDPPKVKGYPYQDLLSKAASRYGLPLPLVLALVRGESFFDPTAKSAKGAIGLMQVMPSTAAEYGVKEKELFDPAKNIDVGVHYLSDLYTHLNDPYLALAAYYCGCDGVDNGKFSLRPDCDEYVRYIYAHLQRILAGTKDAEATPVEKTKRFTLTSFDNFLDAEDFLKFLSEKLPDLQLDIFRVEVVNPDHTRYQYRILVAYGQDEGRGQICRDVKKATGFSFCE